MLTESTDNYNSDSGATCSVQDCGKGSVDSITTWTYETEGSKRVLTETNTDADGTATTEITWVYEVVDACRAVYEGALSEYCGDNDNAMVCIESCAWIAHTVSKTTVDHSADTTSVFVYSYTSGGLTMYETGPVTDYRWTYDVAGNALTQEKLESDGSVAWLSTMTYDADGNMTEKTSDQYGDRTYTWTYDSAGRLIEETRQTSSNTTTTYAYTCE
jgi:YD repeat-containing protein